MAMTLMEHQKKVLKDTKDRNLVAYYIDMGGGKTFIGSEKAQSFDEEVILIVCQKSKVRDWVEHFFTYYIDKTKCDESGAWCYDLTRDDKDLGMFFHSRYKKRIGVINYDLIFRRPALKKLENFTLMLDESSLIQNEKTERWKFISKMHPKNVILLSGTPTSGKYENLWTQIHLLGWNISEDLYQRQYINWTLTEDDGSGIRHKIVNKDDPYKNIDRLKRKLREHGAVFMKTEEFGFDLPEQTFTNIKVDASKEYKKFRKDKVIAVENYEGDEVELVGDTSLTDLLYQRQLCGQYSSEKLQAVKDLIESTNDRLVVFYNFNDELYALKKIAADLERPTSEVNGHDKDLTAYEEQSNSITLIQYQAGAMGLNLQKANKIIYFTLPLSSELFEQSKKRIHRIGQKEHCFYYQLIVRGSVEEQIQKTLKMRKDFTDELFKKNT